MSLGEGVWVSPVTVDVVERVAGVPDDTTVRVTHNMDLMVRGVSLHDLVRGAEYVVVVAVNVDEDVHVVHHNARPDHSVALRQAVDVLRLAQRAVDAVEAIDLPVAEQ